LCILFEKTNSHKIQALKCYFISCLRSYIIRYWPIEPQTSLHEPVHDTFTIWLAQNSNVLNIWKMWSTRVPPHKIWETFFQFYQDIKNVLNKKNWTCNLQTHWISNPWVKQNIASFPSFATWIMKYMNWNTSINELKLVRMTHRSITSKIVASIQRRCDRNRIWSISRMNIVLWGSTMWRICYSNAIVGIVVRHGNTGKASR
jgi:hypothetical protein